MTGREICERAAECKSIKYWYGGKGELASVSLANRLRKENPGTWSEKYYQKALKDIDGKTHVGDCSYLVCHAYQIGMISSYSIASKYDEWNASPKDGMILWRKGHVGIYDSGKVHELKGIDSDYRFDTYDASKWARVLYDKSVVYGSSSYPIGWNRNMETGEWWYQYGLGSDDYYRNRVVRINGDYYAFREDGYMVRGAAAIQTDENGEIVAVI